jgi:hypothetical protein
MVLLEVVRRLKIYQHTKLHGHMLTGASFASNSEVLVSAILELLKLQDYKVRHGFEVTFIGITSILHLIKSTNWFKSY